MEKHVDGLWKSNFLSAQTTKNDVQKIWMKEKTNDQDYRNGDVNYSCRYVFGAGQH